MQRDPAVGAPIVWDDAICEALNVWPVYPREAQHPAYDQKCVESDPIEIDSVWYQDWALVSLTPEELEEKTAIQWQMIEQSKQIILSTPVDTLPSGNVILAPMVELNYDLPPAPNNLIVSGGNVYLDGSMSPTTNVVVDGQQLDIEVDQAVVGSNIYLKGSPGDTVVYISTDVAQAPESNLVVVAAGNVEVVNPYPRPVYVPYNSQEVPAAAYQDYLNDVSNVTTQSNPFEIVWPVNPFGINITNPAD